MNDPDGVLDDLRLQVRKHYRTPFVRTVYVETTSRRLGTTPASATVVNNRTEEVVTEVTASNSESVTSASSSTLNYWANEDGDDYAVNYSNEDVVNNANDAAENFLDYDLD